MKNLNYLLKGFGYDNLQDFKTTMFKIFYQDKAGLYLAMSWILGTIKTFIETSTGLDIAIYVAFVFLIVAEVQTGIKASVKVNKERIKSRKIGRMILKIGVYSAILYVLFTFSSGMPAPVVLGLEVNPFVWLYYVVFTAIVMQLLISWLENLGTLGYKEAGGVVGIVLRKYNRWFEFDGSKNADAV